MKFCAQWSTVCDHIHELFILNVQIENFWILRRVVPVYTDNILIKVTLVTQAVWSNILVWSWTVHVPREMTLISRANGESLDQPEHSIHPSLQTATL